MNGSADLGWHLGQPAIDRAAGPGDQSEPSASADAELPNALEQASAACGLIPAATSIEEFHRRIGDLVQLLPEDAEWEPSREELAVIDQEALYPTPWQLARLNGDGPDLPSDALDGEWDRHLAANTTSGAADEVVPGQVFLSGLPPSLDAVMGRFRLVTVAALGRGVSGAVFTGPSLNTIVVARDVNPDAIDQTFAIYHMVMHVLFGHMNWNAFDWRLEFQRGEDPLQLRSIDGYVCQEEDADDAATCMVSSEYSDGAFLRTFAANARQIGTISKSAIREALRHRHKIANEIANRLQHVAPGVLRTLIDLPTTYTGAIGVVTAEGHPLYLLQRVEQDGQPARYKRWIPSRQVLRALGAANLPTDVVTVSRTEIAGYPEGPMLISPLEVAAARRYLLATAGQSPLGSRVGRDRLIGLKSGSYRAAEGLWPAANFELELPTIAAVGGSA